MKLLELFNAIGFEPRQAVVIPDMGIRLQECTDIGAVDFLAFAKEDLASGSIKGFINAITNAKKAIDCQIDNFILSLGYEHTKISKYTAVKNFVTNTENNTLKLKFLEKLEVIPIKLISKIRKLRNKIEHNYYRPTEDEADEAVELADLFVNCLQRKIFYESFCVFGDGDENTKKQNTLSFHFWEKSSYYADHFQMALEDFPYYSIRSWSDTNKDSEMIIKFNLDVYLYLVKISLSLDSEHESNKALLNLYEFIRS